MAIAEQAPAVTVDGARDRQDLGPVGSRDRAVAGLRGFVRVVLRTLSLVVPVFFFATIITFLLRDISGISPAAAKVGEEATPEVIAQIEHEWGLDRPMIVQYLDWFWGILHGDLGRSWFSSEQVSTLIWQRAWVSLSVSGLALIIGMGFGFGLGLLAYVFRRRWPDRLITGFCAVISTMPAYIVGIVLILIFSVGLSVLPAAGYVPLERGFGLWLAHIILPALALSLDTVSDLARQLRTGLAATAEENYITGAVLRGFSKRRVFFVHTLRNGAAPTVTILGMKFPNLLGGAIVTESIFGMAGYGRFAADSALRGDVPSVQGVLVVAIILVVIFNALVNALLNWLIPAARRGM